MRSDKHKDTSLQELWSKTSTKTIHSQHHKRSGYIFVMQKQDIKLYKSKNPNLKPLMSDFVSELVKQSLVQTPTEHICSLCYK